MQTVPRLPRATAAALRGGRAVALGLAPWTLLTAATGAAADKPADVFRLCFSQSVFVDINENDVRATLRAISATVATQRAIAAEPDPLLVTGTDALAHAIRTGAADAFSLAVDEYWILRDARPFSRILCGTHLGSASEEYLLLARRDRGFSDLTALRGKSLVVANHTRLRIGYLWLELHLARHGIPENIGFFSQIIRTPKSAKPVLDVYFGRADACLTTRRAFEAATELNPQIGAQLAILASSPPLIPGFFGFRASFDPALADQRIRDFTQLNHTPAGQQCFTIFQIGDIAEFPLASLDPTLALLDEYRALRPTAAARLVELLRTSAVGPASHFAP